MKVNTEKTRIKLMFFVLMAIVLTCGCAEGLNRNSRLSYLETDFQNPPRQAGVRCWWWWLNSNVTKEAITRDLEAMHDKGFSGAMIFDAGTETRWGPDKNPPNGPMFSGPEWTELYLHALNEAKRLDLELGLSIQSGWNLGGPFVTLDDKAKQITSSQIKVEGPATVDQKLPTPKSNYEYYRDICVLAYPDKQGSGQARKPIENLTAKSGAKELGGSAPDCRFLLNDRPPVDGEEDTLLENIIDITGKVSEDGTLKWNVPAGKWTVLRIGYTPTQAHVATSSDNWKGHVLDYLSKDVFDRYWYKTVDPLLKKAGPMAGTVLKQLETDSWECGGMNWSPDFAKEFKRYNGYDITKYLPVVAGKIVDSRAVSNAFLADLRKTIAHCVSENHYKTFAENAARYNIGIQPECSGPHAGPVDGITNYSHSDITMSEFWIPSPHRPAPHNRFFVKQASSAAHIYGKQFVGAESFTSLKKPHWAVELWHDMKPHMDYEFCEGLNMIFFHTFTCSPKEMGIPGQEYFAGTHVNPQVTWWDKSDAFMDYINRMQTVLQKGKFVADVLYYYGDHVPNIAVNKGFNRAGSLPGYDYDVTNEEVLLQLKVVDGKLVVPGGVQYRVMVLPDHKVLSLAVLEKVEKLLKQGATVIGPKPERLVSLVGGEKAQQRFHKLADKLWGDSPAETGNKKLGKGRLVWGQTSRQFLQSDNVAFDFEVLGVEKQEDYQYIHYTIDGDDVYFVCNQTNQPQSIDCAFRMTGKQPELWDPVTGEITTAGAFKQTDGKTVIPMEFEPYGSCLVFFRDSIPATKQGVESSNYPVLNVVKEVQGPWQVAFDIEWGGPASVEFKTLTDWTKHADEGIKYYSGEATYSNMFEFKPVRGKRYWLQLNNVLDAGIAAVKLNGKDVGIVWAKPFRLEMTDALNAGQNQMEITVVNTWQNRLIGDRGKPQEKRYTKTNIKIRDDWKLRPSGLLGPVEIKSEVFAADSIDRRALVERHNITFTKSNPAEIPQVGNGEIAFGVDVTGLQTLYGNTLSQWGWHSLPMLEGKRIEDFKMFEVKVHGRTATYPVSKEGQEELYWWLRENPHRLNLGKLSFMLDGKRAEAGQLTDISQKLDLWRGVITSTYKLDGESVRVITTCHPKLDMLAAEVHSPLIQAKRLSIEIAFPYGHATDRNGADWSLVDRHTTDVAVSGRSAVFNRKLDEDRYEVRMTWDSKASLQKSATHTYSLKPATSSEIFSFVCKFSQNPSGKQKDNFKQTLAAATTHWQKFWQTGGAIDLSASKDQRWKELERRVVLSQYLLAVNEAGSTPPQESGLVNNSGWYGKFHLEMHWWHGAHYQLWNRWELFDRSLGWYRDILPAARKIAKRQNYSGARWPKMIGPDGRFGPSGIGPWLIWQQPHPIFYAEQNYRVDPSSATLEKWKNVVFETAEFMASYACKNDKTGKYELGPWVINAAENNSHVKHETINPAFELAYWRYGLQVACNWCQRLGLPEKIEWKQVLENLAPMPVEEGVYVMYDDVPDMWTKFNRSHIDVIGTGAFLPDEGVNLRTLGRTVDKSFNEWNMLSTWGWDFPWLAMAAARAGKPDHAVDALMMDVSKNNYSKCGINTGGPAATYFPGNGGLLYAVAMMAAGWDGAPDKHAPGFPDDGTWLVRYEGLMRAQ